LQKEFNEPFLVLNGDILSLVDFKKMYQHSIKTDVPLTVAIKKEIMPFEFGNIYFDGDFVTGIEEKPDFITYILAGIYVLKPEVLSYIPENEYYGMDHLIKGLLSQKQKIAKYEIEEYWLDIGRVKDYEIAQKSYKKFFKNEL
jgi:NDP-mannose synthase